MNQANLAAPIRLLDIQPRAGSRQHYYHFFFGVLLPLCRYLRQITDEYVPMIVRSCGPLDVMLHELRLPRLMLAEKNSFESIATTLPTELLQRVALTGFDIGKTVSTYDRDAITEARTAVLLRLKADIDKHCTQVASEWMDTPRVLIIDRGPPHAFHQSWLAHAREPGAGASRRRVANHEEMVSGVKRAYPGARSVLLEGIILARQIALFQLADVVVAQHGAALANMTWMRPDAGVIELIGGEPEEAHFRRLAPLLGLPYRPFDQDGPFGPIDPAAMASAIGEMLATPKVPTTAALAAVQ